MGECQERNLGLQNQRAKRKLRCFSKIKEVFNFFSEAATLWMLCDVNVTCDVGTLF